MNNKGNYITFKVTKATKRIFLLFSSTPCLISVAKAVSNLRTWLRFSNIE